MIKLILIILFLNEVKSAKFCRTSQHVFEYITNEANCKSEYTDVFKAYETNDYYLCRICYNYCQNPLTISNLNQPSSGRNIKTTQ